MSSHQHAAAIARVHELVALYADPKAGVADLLCDRHPPGALAYRVVGADLEATDITYGDLRRESEKFAAALAELGVGPGDRVATLMGKSSEYLVAVMGIWRLGAVHVPIFTAFAPAGIAFRLTRSNAQVVVCDETQQAKLLPGDDMPSDASWRIITTAAEGAGIQGALHFSTMMSAQTPGWPWRGSEAMLRSYRSIRPERLGRQRGSWSRPRLSRASEPTQNLALAWLPTISTGARQTLDGLTASTSASSDHSPPACRACS